MTIAVIVSGNDLVLPVTLFKDKKTFAISGSATVQAAVVDVAHANVLAGPVTVDQAAPGSDWANSKIVVEMTPTDTAAIAATVKNAVVEIEVDDGKKLSWFEPVRVVNGLIR